MSQYATVPLDTPVGELEWVIISGEGKEDLSGRMKYQASLVLDPEIAAHKSCLDSVDPFWMENKPAGWSKPPSSTGIYPHKTPTDKKDSDGKTIYEETGKYVLVAKTGTSYADGKPKVIPVFNAKGAQVSLGNKKIGNGSRGRLGVVMAIYVTTDKKGKTLVNSGTTFYLNKVQLTKFVEYEGVGFDALEDSELTDEDTFEGVGDMGGVLDEEASTSNTAADSETTTKAKPRLD